MPTLAAARAGKRVLLANKEAVVMSGPMLVDTAARHGAELVPKKSAQARFRRSILKAFDHRCAYCGGELTTGNTTLDHVKPKATGGQTIPGNLVACCSRCNGKKGARSWRLTSRT